MFVDTLFIFCVFVLWNFDALIWSYYHQGDRLRRCHSIAIATPLACWRPVIHYSHRVGEWAEMGEGRGSTGPQGKVSLVLLIQYIDCLLLFFFLFETSH